MKILLAEDTLDLNKVITSMLEMQGFVVDSAVDGAQALELALSNGYDGIILDIMMPKMNGLEVLKEIRRRNIVTPVLMLTAKAEVDDRVEGLDAGADDYLTKPFAMVELLARINAFITSTSKKLPVTNMERQALCHSESLIGILDLTLILQFAVLVSIVIESLIQLNSTEMFVAMSLSLIVASKLIHNSRLNF